MDVNVDGWQEQEANESEKYVEEQIIDMTIAMYINLLLVVHLPNIYYLQCDDHSN